MPPDPTIRVGITANTGPASAQLEDFGARSKAAMDAYNTAASKSKSVSEALGRSFDEAMASGATFTEAMERATASVNTYTTSANAAAGATRGVTSTFYAAQGASGLLEGRIPIRAMERFLSSSQAVSSALLAAFPIIGAVAIGEVLIQATKRIVEFSEEAGALGRELGTGWLDGAIAQVSGLAKEIKQADDEILKLAGDRDRLRSQQERQDVDQAQLETQIATYKKLTAGLGPENAKNAQAYARAATEAASAGQRAGDALHAEQLQRQIDALEKIKILHVQNYEQLEKQITSSDEISRVGSVGIANLRKQQEVANAQYQDALKQQMVLIQEKNNLLLKGEVATEREDRTAGRGTGKPDDGHKIAAQWGLDEAREKLAAIKEETRGLEQSFERLTDAPFKAIANSEELIHRNAEANARAYRERATAAAGAAQDAQTEAESQHAIALAQIQAAQSSGQLSRTGADHAKAAADAELYRQKLQALQDELAQLIPFSEQYERVLRQIQQLQGQQQVKQIQDQSKTAQDIAGPYIKATDQINAAWLGMQNKLIFGTRFVSQAFANMGVSMLESVAASFEKMLLKQLQFEIQSVIAHHTANTTKVASDATAAAAGDAIKTTSALKENFINAKTAATGAFKGVMSVVPPPLNFILAPVAAAAAFAGTLAVGAFEKGGLITAPTLALMGESGTEAVLPSRLTNMLLNVANGASSTTNQSSSTVFNQQNHYSGMSDREFRQKIRQHSSAVADSVSRELRGGRRR